jgi:dodecin
MSGVPRHGARDYVLRVRDQDSRSAPLRARREPSTISLGKRHMSIVKVIEIIAESPKSWDDAAGQAVAEVAKTVDGITEVWVSGMKALVENNKIVRYRITAKVSFVVKERAK